MKGATIPYAIVALSLLLNHCAPSRYVKPLEKNAQAMSFSFGGPVIGFAGAPIPIPFTTLGYGYGVTNRITGFAHLHLTSLLFGNLQSDIGATIGLSPRGKKIGFSVSPSLQQAYSMRHASGFRLWPSADLNGYYHFAGRRSYLYSGVSSWFELSATRAHQEPQPRRMIPGLHAGYTFAGEKWLHQLEGKYLSPGTRSLPGVVDYKGLSGKGSFGVYYSLMMKF